MCPVLQKRPVADLSGISINLLAFYHDRRSLIGYATLLTIYSVVDGV